MPTLDERVAFLEGRVDEHSRGVGDMRALVVQLDGKVDRRIDGLDGRFEAIDRRFEAIDARFEAIDRRFETIDRRFEAVDRRFEDVDRRFTALEGQIGALDQKVSRQFLWLMGALTTVLVSVIGSLLGVVLTLG
jgi:tetrahydromethanopterin S-methyltransferase subunit G